MLCVPASSHRPSQADTCSEVVCQCSLFAQWKHVFKLKHFNSLAASPLFVDGQEVLRIFKSMEEPQNQSLTHTWKDCEEALKRCEAQNSFFSAQLFKLGITPLITLIQIAGAVIARLCLFSALQHWWFGPKALEQVRQNDLRLSAGVKVRHGAAAWGSVPCPARYRKMFTEFTWRKDQILRKWWLAWLFEILRIYCMCSFRCCASGCSSLQYGTIAAKQNKDIVLDHILFTAVIEESSFLEFGRVSIFGSTLASQQSAPASSLVS